MIGYIKGRVMSVAKDKVIVLVNDGVGYKINTSKSSFLVGQDVQFFVSTIMKESSIELYGFESDTEKEIFELLITVSGVGPKSAQSLLSQRNIDEIIFAISSKSSANLKVSGIGSKTTEKIVIELNSKVDKYQALLNKNFESAGGTKLTEVYDVMEGLGYSRKELSSIIAQIDMSEDLPVIVKKILSLLKK